jgi:hypothetical protein
MFATDAALVFEELERLGLLTTVQVERLVATGTNARGRRTESVASVGSPIAVFVGNASESLLAAPYGDRTATGLVVMCQPEADIQAEDRLLILSGRRKNCRYRVLDIPMGEGPVAPVTASVELMPRDAA